MRGRDENSPLANQSAQSAPLDCGRGPQLWARSMTARFMFEGSKHSESKQEARGHRPRPQLSGCASSPCLAKYVSAHFNENLSFRIKADGIGCQGRASVA